MGKQTAIHSEYIEAALFCTVISTVLLAVCSKSSPLYPFNDWVDSNIFFTVGKGMMEGKVLYRDIYDQKGPLLFFVHGLAYLFSHRSFLGVYLIEVICFSLFLLGVYRLMRLYTDEMVWWSIPVIGAVVVVSDSFCHGDSAEELCLPIFIWSFYALLRYFRLVYPEPASRKMLLLHGVLAGCLLWVKFTFLGFHFAWMVSILIGDIRQKRGKGFFLDGLTFLGGMALATLPWLIYFGLNHAVGDWLGNYIWNNIFSYSTAERAGLLAQVKSALKNLLDLFIANPGYSVLIIGGVIWFIAGKSRNGMEKLALSLLCVFTAAGICFGVIQWRPYYGLILCVFAVTGLLGIQKLLEEILGAEEPILVSGGLVCTVLCVMFALRLGNYTDQIGRAKEELVQYRFAEIIEETENPTLLNYGFQDSGFYTVCGIVPSCRYFCSYNLELPGLWEEQQYYLENGLLDYVVTRGFELEDSYVYYEEVERADQVYEGIEYTYYLYKRK